MPYYREFQFSIIPFKAKKLLLVLFFIMLAAAAFLFAVEVYVSSTHKHKQPPVRSPHGHANSTPRSSMDPGASPGR